MQAYSLRLYVYEVDRPTWTDTMALAAEDETEAMRLARELLGTLGHDERYDAHLLDKAGRVAGRIGGTIHESQVAADP